MFDWYFIIHIDINNAFLNDDLHENVSMHQPPGCEKTVDLGNILLCKLQKLYMDSKKLLQLVLTN